MIEFLLPVGAVLTGLAMLVKGGDWLVDHAAHLARSYRVPKTVVGAVVLGFGTSLPELSVSLTAALEGSPSLTLGNVVGSNIANVGLILGFGALLAGLHVGRNVIRFDLPLGVLASLFMIAVVGPQGAVTRPLGFALLALFAFYLFVSMRYARQYQAGQIRESAIATKAPLRDSAWILLGLVTIVIGAEFLVYGASEMARLVGVSERVIGLSLVALGTSLPELAALLAAVRKGEADLAVGNVAGSNLFNLLFVLGTTAAIHPLDIEPVLISRDFPVMAGFAVLAFPILSRERRLGRVQGGLMLALWIGYILWTVGPDLVD